MNIAKNYFLGLAVSCWLASLSSPGNAADVTQLNITYSPANMSEMYKALAAAFTVENPEIKISLHGYASYPELLQQSLRGEITGTLPDVSHEGLNNIRIYADRRMAIPLNQFINREADWNAEGYSDAVSRIGNVMGDTYAMPFSISTQNIFFNLDLVARAGWRPDRLPTEWPQILELAKAIDRLDGNISGIYYDYGANGALAFQTLLFSQGGSMMTPDEKDIAFDRAEGKWAMSLLAEFGKAGQIDMSRDNARQAFIAGTLGIYENTSSNLGNFDKQIGSRFKYTMIPVPTSAGGHLPAAGNGMVMFAKEPAQQKAAWKYIKFASGPKGQAIMAKMTGYVPVNRRVLEDEDMKRFYDENPNYAVALGQVRDLTAWYLFPGRNGVKAMDVLTDSMGDVVNLRKTPDEALNESAAAVRSLLRSGG